MHDRNTYAQTHGVAICVQGTYGLDVGQRHGFAPVLWSAALTFLFSDQM
jgi:hypothetical protein